MVAEFWQRSQLRSVVMIAERGEFTSCSNILESLVWPLTKRLFVRRRRGCGENQQTQVIFSEFICAFVVFAKCSGCFKWSLKRHLFNGAKTSAEPCSFTFVIDSMTLEANLSINRCWHSNRCYMWGSPGLCPDEGQRRPKHAGWPLFSA